jgi:hypothetical protein
MVSISSNLYKQLRTTLLDCGPFANNDLLRSIFVDARIHCWRDRLPRARTAFELVDLTISFLLEQTNAQNENALVLFLLVLRDQKSPEEACYRRLAVLAKHLEDHLRSSSPSLLIKPAPLFVPTPQDLLACFETKFRAQDLKKVYFLLGIEYDELLGSVAGKNEKAMALIEYCQKRSRVADLYLRMQEVYPELEC